MFDVSDAGVIRHEWDVDLPIESEPWQIGLIVGPSGSGKTTLGRRLFHDAMFHEGYSWPETASVVDGFPKNIPTKDITHALSSVGFSSPPHWLKRFSHLSNGQKFRAELARLMLEDVDCVVVDEWTSIVDRDVAKICSAAVSKALRSRGRPKLVALSCHFDVIDWLDPDWVYNVATGEFARRSLRRRPPIKLEIHAATTSAWRMFNGHHYLSRVINKACKCFVATIDGSPVAFTSYIHQPNKIRNIKREHRTVVLPDYQGVGIGNALSEWLGEYLSSLGFIFCSVTSHPSMIRHRAKSTRWEMRRIGHQTSINSSKKVSIALMNKTGGGGRITASFVYKPKKKEKDHGAEVSDCGRTGVDVGGVPSRKTERAT